MIHRSSSLCSVLARSAAAAADVFGRVAGAVREPGAGRLLAVAVVAAGLGVSAELHAAMSGPSSKTVARGVTAVSPDWSSIGQVSENGDGTAFTAVFTPVGPNEMLGTLVFDNTSYSVATSFPQGQSGNGTGSGVGHFTCDGMILNTLTWETTGPFPVSVDVSALNTTTLSASMSQGVKTETNPLTGEISVVRKHTIGSQAEGDAAGSLTININGAVVTDTTGGWGMASIETVHNIERIH